MHKIQKHIEIVRTISPGMSSLSLTSCNAILASLKNEYQIVGVTTVNNLTDLETLAEKKPDLVFLGLEYLVDTFPGEFVKRKIWISSFLEQKGIEHTGSTKNAAKFGRFKDLAKQRVQSVGLKTADYILIKQGATFDSNSFHLEFPVFVKPASLGGGQGIDDGSVVRSRSELLARISMLSNKFASDILIEEYLSGREFSVAVLMDEAAAKLQALPVEIIAGANMFGDRILGSSAKKLDEEVVIAVADMKIKNSITELAIGVFRAIGARDYGRIDIRLDKAGNPNFIEANLIPSLIRNYGNFPKACVINLGLQYEEMLTTITGLGLARAEAFEPIEQEYLCDSLLAVGS